MISSTGPPASPPSPPAAAVVVVAAARPAPAVQVRARARRYMLVGAGGARHRDRNPGPSRCPGQFLWTRPGHFVTICPNAFLDNYRTVSSPFIEKPFVTTSFKQSGIIPHDLPPVTPNPQAPSFVVLASEPSRGQGEVVTRASLGKTLMQLDALIPLMYKYNDILDDSHGLKSLLRRLLLSRFSLLMGAKARRLASILGLDEAAQAVLRGMFRAQKTPEEAWDDAPAYEQDFRETGLAYAALWWTEPLLLWLQSGLHDKKYEHAKAVEYLHEAVELIHCPGTYGIDSSKAQRLGKSPLSSVLPLVEELLQEWLAAG